MEELILIGGGGHCRSCIDVIETEQKFRIAGIIDKPEKISEEILGYRIIGTDDQIKQLIPRYRYFLVTVGQIRVTEIRKNIFEQTLALGGELPVIISPTAYVSRHTQIGAGTIIMHGCVVNAGAVIGKNCIINSNALIEHDSVVGDHCHVATCAIVNGGVVVGEGSFIGSGAVTKQYTILPKHSFVKAGTLFKG
jgi:sugar O-acyltransferase (sialic acid O-acetyltransferase NeuD family)